MLPNLCSSATPPSDISTQSYKAPSRDPAFKICSPTLILLDLTKWLLSLTASIDYIKFLFIHVGVNDCRSGAVPPEAWHNLITLCKSCFPSAIISMSSIVPARGRHHFNMIAPSNRHLRAVCAILEANLIDNHNILTTANGAPRLALYDGLCEPSRKGTARLAVNLKEHNLRTYGSERIEDEAPSTPPSYWRSSLYTVSYANAGTSVESHSLAVLQEFIVATGMVTLTTNSLPFLQQSTSQSCRAGQNDHLISTQSQVLLQWLLVILFVPSSFMTPGTIS